MVISLPLYYLFSPFIMGLIGVIGDKLKISKIREITAILLSLWGPLSIWQLYNNGIKNGKILVFSIGGAPPLGACFEIDALSIFMAASVSLLTFFVTVYSLNYMDHDTRLTEYYSLLFALTVGIMGVAFAGDLFTLFIFWELTGIASYVLVSFRKNEPDPVEAGFKYMVMGSVGSTVLFFGMALLYGMTGTVNLAQLSSVLKGQPLTPWISLIFILLLIGFGVKTAIVPLHTWLPDAHPAAPSPISAMLSGIVIETGLYAMIRLFFLLFEPSFFMLPMAFLAVLTMTLGNISALLQNDIKRLLAYSSIAQLGYMLIGLAAGTTYGIMGVLLHVLNHSLLKGMAFLSAGSMVHETDTRDIENLRGISRSMPITSVCLFIALLGLGGVPGTNGFISKFILFNSAIGSDMMWLTIIGILNSALSMGYYIKVIGVLVDSKTPLIEARDPPVAMLGVTIVMAILILAFGLWPNATINYASTAARSLINNLPEYVEMILG